FIVSAWYNKLEKFRREKKLLRQLPIPGIEKKKGTMDPPRAPDFKPPSADEELIPPPDPESKIPKSIPI
ncbi:hypothetical protein LIZ81_17660, partial [Eggerthella sinensis]|nr:hypothetical protein [Eggerthella sinensis]